MREFRVDRRVRLIPAGGNVEVMHRQAIWQPRGAVARVAGIAKGLCASVRQRQARQDRNAVVALVPLGHHMAVASISEDLQRDLVYRAFGFLKAQHVWRLFGQKAQHQISAKPDRVNVPRADCDGHNVVPYVGRTVRDGGQTLKCESPRNEKAPDPVFTDQATIPLFSHFWRGVSGRARPSYVGGDGRLGTLRPYCEHFQLVGSVERCFTPKNDRYVTTPAGNHLIQ